VSQPAIEYQRTAQPVRVRENERRISIVVAPPPRWSQIIEALYLLLILIGGAGLLVLIVYINATDPKHLKLYNVLILLLAIPVMWTYAGSTYRRMIRLVRFGRMRIRVKADAAGLILLDPLEIGRRRRFLNWESIRDAKAGGGWSMLLVPVVKLKIVTRGLETITTTITARDPQLMDILTSLLARRPRAALGPVA
jgi:hypothetical protein